MYIEGWSRDRRKQSQGIASAAVGVVLRAMRACRILFLNHIGRLDPGFLSMLTDVPQRTLGGLQRHRRRLRLKYARRTATPTPWAAYVARVFLLLVSLNNGRNCKPGFSRRKVRLTRVSFVAREPWRAS